MTFKHKTNISALLLVLWCMSFSIEPKIGDPIDNLNGIPVFYNGHVSNVYGRNVGEGGYNFGLKYQCVEFIKRYYFLQYQHKMPNTFGHAKSFFNKSIPHGGFNKDRGLTQFHNVNTTKPEKGDIIVYDGNSLNPYGHIAIISEVTEEYVEIIQQNWGKVTRKKISFLKFDGYFSVADYQVLGWLRK